MLKIREAVANFLRNTADQNKTLVSWWHPELETQVQVLSNTGEKTDFGGFTKDGDTWWHIRWPKNGKTTPTWKPKTQTFDLSKYAESIGTSGWNWEDHTSEFVCFDLDSVENHAEGLSDSELNEFIEKGAACDYVDVFSSTSGKGIHYYVRFDPESLPPSANRVEHKTVAHYVLSKLKQDIGDNLIAKLDVCGNIFWIWSRRMTDKSYQHLSSATRLLRYDEDFVDGWKEKAEVVKTPYTTKRIITSYFGSANLSKEHTKIANALSKSGYSFAYDQSEKRITTHTKALQELSKSMDNFVGAFTTKSTGADTKQNCFMFPVDNGGFTVFRFGNVKEDFPWKESKNKNCYCMFNSPMDPVETFLHFNLEHQPKHSSRKERFCADCFESLIDALKFLGCDHFLDESIKEFVDKFYIELVPTTSDSLKICVDSQYKEAIKNRGFQEYSRGHFKSKVLKYKHNRFGVYKDNKKDRDALLKDDQIIEVEGLEHIARHTKQQAIYGVDSTQEGQWWVGSDIPGEGHRFCRVRGDNDVVKVLQSEYPGMSVETAKIICGDLIKNPWLITCVPFQPEYSRAKQWNMSAPKLVFKPANLDDCEQATHPTWDKIFSHCGQELDEVLKDQPWYGRWGLHTGKEYLTAWTACMLFEPDKKLPYLFLHGNQETGKSSFHEAIRLLIQGGVEEGSRPLTNTSSFNGQLEGTVLVYIEEIDLSRKKQQQNIAYERIKDWTVSPYLSLRHMYRPPYFVKNYLHFVQVANQVSACPIDQDDTRVTALLVPPIEGEKIPTNTRDQRLRDEAPNFMVTLKRAHRRLPPMEGRLRIPVVKTQSKCQVIETLSNELMTFVRENCLEKRTKYTSFGTFYTKFMEKSPSDVHEGSWSTSKVKRELLNNHIAVEGSGNSATIKGLILKEE